MNKNTFRFEVSFNLNTAKGEKLDSTSIRALQTQLHNFVSNWSGESGCFLAYGSEYGERDIFPTNIKVRRMKQETWKC